MGKLRRITPEEETEGQQSGQESTVAARGKSGSRLVRTQGASSGPSGFGTSVTAPVGYTEQAVKNAATIRRREEPGNKLEGRKPGFDTFASQAEEEAGFRSWLERMDDFSTRTVEESKARQEGYTSAQDMGTYRDSALAEIEALTREGAHYQRYFQANQDCYQQAGEVAEEIGRNRAWLSGVRENLGEEFAYWDQFGSEEEYRQVQERAALEELDQEGREQAMAEAQAAIEEAGRMRSQAAAMANVPGQPGAKEKLAEADKALEEAQARVALLEELEAEAQAETYRQYMDREDWEELSAPGASKVNPNPLVFWDRGDERYDYINDINGARARGDLEYAANSSVPEETVYLARMTGDEVGIYNYLYAKEGRESADRYVELLLPELERRAAGEWTEHQETLTREHPVLMSAMSVPVSVLGGAAAAYDLGAQNLNRVLTGKAVNYDSPVQQLAGSAETIRGTIAGDLEENVPLNVGETNVPAMLYQTLMSGADSLAAGLAGPTVGGVMLGASAASSTARDVAARGGTDDQALVVGLAAGVFEMLFERVSLGNLQALKEVPVTGVKDVVMNVAKSMGVNASEEMATELANIVFDAIAMGDISNWELSIRNYMAQGLSREEAATRTVKDLFGQVLEAGVSGGLMGAGFGLVGSIQSGLANRGARDAEITEPAQKGPVAERSPADTAQQAPHEAGTETAIPEAVRTAVDMLVRGEEISGNQAARIARNEEALALLTELTGESINTDAPLSRVKSDIRALASRGSEASESAVDGGQVRQEAAPGTSQESTGRAAAQAAYDMSRMRRAAEASGFGESGQKALTAVYDGMTDGFAYYAGFAAYYNAGVAGQDMGKVRSPYAQDLNEAQRYAAYTAGQNDAAASLQREREGVEFATVYGDEAELIENDNAARIPQQTAALYDTLAKAAGVKIELVDQVVTPDGEDGGNGAYDPKTGVIQISINADGVQRGGGGVDAGALTVVAAHEITHRLQDLAPEEYRQYRDYAVGVKAAEEGGVEHLVAGTQRRYAGRQVNLTTEQAMDEIAAEFTRDMLRDEKLFQNLAQTDRSLARRVLDALRDFIRRVKAAFTSRTARDRAAETEYGVSMAELEEAARLWQSAYDAAGREVRRRTGQTQAGSSTRTVTRNGRTVEVREDGSEVRPLRRSAGGDRAARFSIRTVDGKNVVWIENSSLTNKELNSHRAVANFIAQHIGEVYTIIESGQKVYIGPDLPGEYTQSRYTSYLRQRDAKALKAKNKAVDGLGELIETATNRRWEKTRHAQSKDAKYGMYRYDSTFAFPVKGRDGAVQRVRAYDVELLIRNASDGKKYLYDIVGIKENTTSALDLMQREARKGSRTAAARGDVSNTSIAESGGHVNGRFSLKATDSQGREERQEGALQGRQGDATMRQVQNALKEDAEHGRREESREDFYARWGKGSGRGFTIMEGPTAAYGFRRVGDSFEGGYRGEVTPQAGETHRELTALGISADIVDGPVLRNSGGATTIRDVLEAASADQFHVFISKDATLSARNIAGHEAFHIWKNSPGRDVYIETVEENLIFTSPEFLRFQSTIAEAYLGGEADLADGAQMAKLREELFAYISGDIHEGVNDGYLRPMFRDYDAVKAAWRELVRTNSTDERAYSIKGGDILRENAALQEENALLRERMEYWRGQTRRTERVTTDKKAVERAARELIDTYNADLTAEDITGDLQGLFDYMASGRDGRDELTYNGARRRSDAIARKIVENASVRDDELYRQYKDLRDYVRTTALYVSEADSQDIPDYGAWRRQRFGRMNLRKGPTNIDQVYQEMSYLWPEFFDEQRVSHPMDQLLHIAEVLDTIYSVEERNPFGAYLDAAVVDVSNEIMERFFDLPQTRRTFADRQAAKLDEAKAAGRRRLAEQRERNDARLAQLRQQNRERVQRTILGQRMAAGREIAKLKRLHQEQTKAAKDRQSRRELRARISRHASELSRKLLRPSDKQHIPDDLRTAVDAMLEAINLESAYTIDPETGKRQKKDGGLPTKRTEAFRALREQYAKIAENGGDMVIDPALFSNKEEDFIGKFDRVLALRDVKLDDMSAEQLQLVWEVLRAVEHSVRTAGRVLSQTKYQETQDWARALERDTASRKSKRTLTESGALKSLENPYTFFSHFGEAGHAIFRMLRSAQDKQQVMQKQVKREARKIADPRTVKRLERTAHTFTTVRGDSLILSTDQVMELYVLMKQEQAQKHLLPGGIVQPKVESKRVRRGTDATLLSAEDLKNMVEVLSEEEREIADALQKLTAGPLADLGNEASMTAYGYKKFTGTNYWPINTAKEGNKSTPEKGKSNAKSIKNTGLAKERVPNASNALDLPGIFNTFAAHAAEMIDYAAWLAPMEDANRLFNYKYRDGEGNPTGRTVKGLLDRVGGSGSQEYWAKLMEDIQNGISAPGDDPMTRIVSRGIGSFKGAAVGGNLRVVIQQPTAFFRAGTVLSPADLSRGLARGVTRGSGWKKALQHSPIAMRKDEGGFDISSPVTMKESLFDGRSPVRKFNDAMSWGAGKADAFTWGRLWNACEWATAREHKDLKKGSEEFYRKVNELFTEVIDQTQVVDGVLQRSNIMRSRNAMAQQATSFMGEPIMSLNIALRAYDQMRYEQDPKKRGKAIKHLGRAATALVVTNVVNALAQSLVDGIRDDDKDKKYRERFLSAFTGLTGEEGSAWDKAVAVVLGGNMGSALNPAGQIPYVRDVLSLAQGYDVSRTDMEIFADLVRAAQTVMQSADGKGAKTRAYAVKELLAAGAKVFGIPVGNLARDLWGFVRSIAIETDNIPLMYEMEKVIYNISNTGNTRRYLDILYLAQQSGDKAVYEHIYTDLVENGMPEETIRTGMEDRMKKDQGVTSVEDLERRYLTPKQEKDYDRLYGQVSGSSVWRAASPEQRENVEEDIYALITGTGAGVTLQEKIDGGAAYGISEADYLLYLAAREIADAENEDPEKRNGSIDQEETEAAIDMLAGLSDEARAYLWQSTNKGWSEKNNPYN